MKVKKLTAKITQKQGILGLFCSQILQKHQKKGLPKL